MQSSRSSSDHDSTGPEVTSRKRTRTPDVDAALPRSSASSGSNEIECWICRDSSSTPENPIVTGRCLCVGSVGFVHRECIDAWVLENGHLTCTSCGAHYRIASTGLPDGVVYPTSWYGQIRVIVSLLVLPLVPLVAEGLVRTLVFWVGEALLLGTMLFWQRALRAVWHSSHTSAPTSEPLVSAWDVLNAAVYGLILLNVMRMLRNGYWSWIASFGWPKPAEAFEGVDAADLELSSDSEASGDDLHGDANGDAFADGDDGEDWVTSSEDMDEAEREPHVDAAGHGGAAAEGRQNEAPAVERQQMPEQRRPPAAAQEPQQGVQHSRANTAWCAFHFVRKARKMLGVHRSAQVLWQHALRELLIGLPLTFCFGSVPTTALLAVVVVVASVAWRIKYPRKRLRNPARRYDEVGERKPEATEMDAYLWFCTYWAELISFSVFLPIIIGAAAHYAVSPYFVPFPQSVGAFLDALCPVQVLIYWVLGSIGAFALMQVEALMMVPLFAPGVDLFFIRSVDLQFTIDTDYWRFILTQVFDADPLVILYSFVRMTLIETTVLFLFLRVPAMGIHHSANTLAAMLHRTPRELPPPVGVPVRMGSVAHIVLAVISHTEDLWKHLLSENVGSSTLRSTLWAGVEMLLTVWTMATIMVTIGFVRQQRLQLRALRPFALFVGRHVVRMEAFLFDNERLALIDTFLRFKDIDRLDMPMVPESEVFNRRQLALRPDEIPSKLSLRLMLFSVLFFVYAATMFWLVPAALLSVFAVFIRESFSLLLVGVVASGFVVDTKSMTTTVIPVCLCLPLIVPYMLFTLCHSFVSFLLVSVDSRARDALDFHHHVRQTVDAFTSQRSDSETPPTTETPSSEWSDADVDLAEQTIAS